MAKYFSSKQTDSLSYPDVNDEVDLKQIILALLRHKFLIAKVSAASILISGIYAFTRQPVWEGHFAIVLASNKSTTSQANK